MARKGPKRPAAPEGGWPGQRKTPRQEGVVAKTKTPRSLGVTDERVDDRRPVWRFADVDDGGDWSLHTIKPEEFVGLLDKLKSFESMTIGEIFAPGQEHGKRYPVNDLPAAAWKRLLELERDDETELVRLRCGGQPRLYGFLREHVFHVLWWDPLHEVWPSKLRNT